MDCKKYFYVGPDERLVLENVNTPRLVVDGMLVVNGLLSAETISGKGSVQAGEIQFGVLKLHSVMADTATGRQFFANQACIRVCHVRDHVTATDFLEAGQVITRKLAASLTDIQDTQAEEIITLNSRKHGFLWTLFSVWLKERKIRRCAAKKKALKGKTPEGNAQEGNAPEPAAIYRMELDKEGNVTACEREQDAA